MRIVGAALAAGFWSLLAALAALPITGFAQAPTQTMQAPGAPAQQASPAGPSPASPDNGGTAPAATPGSGNAGPGGPGGPAAAASPAPGAPAVPNALAVPTTPGPSANGARDYESVLLEVYGAMQGVRGVKEICDDAFPEYSAQNQLAHARWLENYKSVRLEVSHRVDALIARESHGDDAMRLAMRNDLRREYVEMKKGLTDQYRASGVDRFRSLCQRYPEMTRGDSVNIPVVYRNELDIIRKVPATAPAELTAAEAVRHPPKSASHGKAAKARTGKGKSGKAAKGGKPAKAAKGKSGEASGHAKTHKPAKAKPHKKKVVQDG